MDNPLILEKRGALAEITLNRPQVLNALNDQMREKIMATLPELSSDPENYALILRSNNPRAFCAGGDVRELTDMARQDPDRAARSVGYEYLMNWTLECFSKPTVSLIDGMVMGSGVGIALYGTHRVAGAGFKFAMPETAIGLFPDVGVCAKLAKMPGQMGYYLGLTGRAIGRATAYRLGLVTHCIDAEQFSQITSGLEDADTVDPLLDDLHRGPARDDEELAGKIALIEDVFGHATVTEMFDALERQGASGNAQADWCAEVLRDLRTRSPLSLLVTLRHLNACRDRQLRDVLIHDYRLAVRFLQDDDLQEGVRAVLIDKDGAPKWRHSSLSDVQPFEVDNYFKSLGADELELPERSKMQEIKV
ncbi:MAG: enoyl-CoA hydratase [Hyphomicrobiaceae bacterium]